MPASSTADQIKYRQRFPGLSIGMQEENRRPTVKGCNAWWEKGGAKVFTISRPAKWPSALLSKATGNNAPFSEILEDGVRLGTYARTLPKTISFARGGSTPMNQ